MNPDLLWEITLGSWLTAALLILVRTLLGRYMDPKWRARLWLLLALRVLPIQLLPITLIPLQSPVSLLRYAPDLETAATYLSPGNGTAAVGSSVAPITGTWPVLRRVWLIGIGAVLLVYLFLYLTARLKLWRFPPCGDLETEREYLRLHQCCHPGFNPRLVRGTQGMLGGFFRPTLVIPVDRLGKWAAPIMLHEMMHYRAGDMWFGLLFRFLCALYWFNPVLWLCFWLMRRDEELACDERVLESGLVSPADYANTLLEEFLLRSRLDPMPLARFGAAGVKRRIRSILAYRQRSRGACVLPALLGLVILILAALSPYKGRSYGFDRSIPAQVGYPDAASYIQALQPKYGAFGMTPEQLIQAGYLGEGEGLRLPNEGKKQVLSIQRELAGEERTLLLIFQPTLFTADAGISVLTEIRVPIPPLDLDFDWQGRSMGFALLKSSLALNDCPAAYSGPYKSLLNRDAFPDWGILDWMETREEIEAHEDLLERYRFGRTYSVHCSPVTLGDCLSAEEAETLAALTVEAGMARSLEEGRSLVQSWRLCGLLGSNYCDCWRLMGMGIALYETRPAE